MPNLFSIAIRIYNKKFGFVAFFLIFLEQAKPKDILQTRDSKSEKL